MKRLAKYFMFIGVSLMALIVQASPVEAPELTGIWKPGAMLIGQTESDATVLFNDKALTLTPRGQFIVALGRDAQGPVQLKIMQRNQQQVFEYQVQHREYNIQRIEGVPQNTVTPPPQVLSRIRKETALVKKARAGNDLREDFLDGFIKPLEGPITGVYGSQRVYNGTPKNPHYGLDIARPTGTLVRAPAPGIVKLTHDDMYFSGGTLIIDHGYGLSSTFIHLSEIIVEQGARVEQGQDIAKVGSSGRATGPHLDWRMNWHNVRIDPALVLEHFPVETSQP